jgi:mannitol/fructose-specific phosphotransferase system IIA component (Ntr-type)
MRSILAALQEGRLFELPQAGKDRALEFLARILDANPDIEVGTDAIEAIQQREQECNTGLGSGVAVPHVRAKRDEGELFCAIGWSQQGIDYGAPDGQHVHLVCMYYIPAAQKNVYLKEVSLLVKAIKKSGGIDPIAHTDDLNVVRNRLLDWVSEGLGESGPEAVARMIKLEVKQAQTLPAPALAVPAGAAPLPAPVDLRATPFAVLIAPPHGPFVLASDSEWGSALESESELASLLARSAAFRLGARQVVVIATTPYPRNRTLYQCVALTAG